MDHVWNSDLTGLLEQAFPDAPQVEIDMSGWFDPTMENGGVSEAEPARSLGWHVLSGELLLALLRRVEAGESADMVLAEAWANADVERPWEEDG